MDTAMSTSQRNMTPSELMALVPSSAPAGLKLNWNKTAGKWYYYISSYSYDPNKKRSVESRTLVGHLNKDNEFVFNQRYLLSLRAARAKPSIPDEQTKNLIRDTRSQCSEMLPDHRAPALVVYPLDIIFVVSFLSSLCGGSNCMQIADYWKTHRDYLAQLFEEFPNKDISHDTVHRVLMLCDPDKFEELFRTFALRLVNEVGSRVVNFDGQMVRATKQSETGKNARYILSFYDSTSEISLCQILIDEKSNEIPAVQKLIPQLDLTDCIVTADAMHAQTKTVSLIAKQNGHYCIALKGNQNGLYEYVETYFERPGSMVRSHTTYDDAHGRQEHRCYEVLPASLLPKGLISAWPGLSDGTIMKVTARRKEKTTQKESIAVRYYISSIVWVDPSCHLKLAHVARQHWSIENGLHHVLDVNMLQDAIQCTNWNYLKNRTVLNKLANNVHSKYRQWLERNDKPLPSKARLLKALANPQEAIKAWLLAEIG